jgi:Xaa-Pro aminopeptidase
MKRPQLTEFIKRMDNNAVAIFAAAPERVRSNDTHYRYRPDSDLLYLTGFEEPEAVVVLAPKREKPFTMFVRPKDKEREIWDGFRYGVEGAVSEFGADEAFPINELPVKLDDYLNNAHKLYYCVGKYDEIDEIVVASLRRLRAGGRKKLAAPPHIVDPGTIVHEMRLFKSPEELAIMQRAADISAAAHVEAMQTVRPGMNEYEVEAMMDFYFRKHGAGASAYGSIIGGGANATVLHYVSNNAPLNDGDLLLIDAGAELQGYAADITRTFPINGKYSKEQREIYDLVLKTQVSCVDMVRPGVTNDDIKNHSIRMITEGLLSLGLLAGDADKIIEEKKYEAFYMHGLGHYLGIDVHDVGRYYIDGEPRPLEPGMVMTVEPGIYVGVDNADVPAAYRGIGVRIEDDVLCTSNGPRVLTHKAPKDADEIEDLIAAGKG